MTKEEYAMKEEFAAARTVKSELTNLEEELSALGASVEEVAIRYSAAARYPEPSPSPAPALAQRDDVPSGDSDLLRALQGITQRARAIRYELDDFISRSQL